MNAKTISLENNVRFADIELQEKIKNWMLKRDVMIQVVVVDAMCFLLQNRQWHEFARVVIIFDFIISAPAQIYKQ